MGLSRGRGSKVALVTGASRGIGRAIALELAGAGTTVVVNYFRSGEDAETVARTIENKGGSALSSCKLDGVWQRGIKWYNLTASAQEAVR